jgi:thiol-disulfide isomerase/thioredoxin
MNRLRPARFAQFVVGALAAWAIAFTLVPRPREAARPVILPARRHPMPDFTMPDLEGASWTLSAHRGRIVLVNFWATWCAPCREEIPDLVRLAKSERGLDIAGIAMDAGDNAQVRQFVKAAGLPYAVLLPAGPSPLADAIDALPTSFLVDKEGRIAQAYFGAVSEKTVREDVGRLQAEN